MELVKQDCELCCIWENEEGEQNSIDDMLYTVNCSECRKCILQSELSIISSIIEAAERDFSSLKGCIINSDIPYLDTENIEKKENKVERIEQSLLYSKNRIKNAVEAIKTIVTIDQ